MIVNNKDFGGSDHGIFKGRPIIPNYPAGTEENHGKPRSRQTVRWGRFERY